MDLENRKIENKNGHIGSRRKRTNLTKMSTLQFFFLTKAYFQGGFDRNIVQHLYSMGCSLSKMLLHY